MQALRRAIGRKDVMFALLLFLLAGGWFSWHRLIRPAWAQVGGASSLKELLDAGQFAQVISQADTMLAVQPAQPQVLRYKAIAQHLTGPSAGALQTVDAAPSAGASGADLSVLLAVKALELAGYDYQQIPEAKQAAAQAFELAGSDADAALLARIACAAAQRCEVDQPDQAPDLLQRAAQIAQVLDLLYAAGATEPRPVWASRLWRRGLALMADSQMLAGAAGDPVAEQAALALLQRLCPQDAWACYFSIPQKALAAVRSGALDDHARAAMLTATGFLYTKEGDRVHCDACFRKAIQAYGRLLEAYDGWAGDQGQTVTPKGNLKTVGSEFYDYRNRMERLAKYSADWWGMRVVRGHVDMPTALGACDHKLFRAIVRVRADRETDPILILQQEHVREVEYSTVGAWFLRSPYAPQADWERQRGELIERIGAEEAGAVKGIAEARRLFERKLYDEALAVLARGLQTEPSLAETGVSYRCEVARVLMDQRRHEEALGMLDEADQVLQAGDERLAYRGPGELRERIAYYRFLCVRGTNSHAQAVDLGEQIVADTEISLVLRARALVDLVDLYIDAPDEAKALEAFDRLTALPATPAQTDAFLRTYLRVAQSRLDQIGWHKAPPASQG